MRMFFSVMILFVVVSMSMSSAFWPFDWSSRLFTGLSVTNVACSDSDGLNTSILGTTSGSDIYGGNLSSVATYTDRCQNPTMVLEFSCKGADGVIGTNVSCSQACVDGVCTNLSMNASVKNATTGNINSSSASAFPDPLSPESEDFFEEFTLEDFITPAGVANAQPDLPRQIAPTPGDEEENVSTNESSRGKLADEEYFDPPLNKLLLNLTVNTTSTPLRLIGRGTFVEKSVLFPQFLPNVRPDAGLYANCDFVYQNDSVVSNVSLPRGSSTMLYVSALSPSFKCPRRGNVDLEIAYRLVNVGVAEVFPNGAPHACRAPWYSPSLQTTGLTIVRTPFTVQRVIVKPGKENRVVQGTFVVPVRSGSATNFNHFHYTSPRSVYLEAFRGNTGDYVSMEFTLVRCVEGKGAHEVNRSRYSSDSKEIPEPRFFTRAWCKVVSWFGMDYESCLYKE